jgi:small subunit ribosomal protein S9
MAEAKKTTAKAPAKKTAAPKTTAKPAAKKKEKAPKIVSPKIENATYATGKRKNSVARVYLALGKGTITINGRPMAEYFKRKVLQLIVEQPFNVANVSGRYDVRASVVGGGMSGQAGAVKHGISRALQTIDPALRPALKKSGFLTRDSRVVERKHFGYRKARRSTQYSKR